jgi:hypothetical protein
VEELLELDVKRAQLEAGLDASLESRHHALRNMLQRLPACSDLDAVCALHDERDALMQREPWKFCGDDN